MLADLEGLTPLVSVLVLKVLSEWGKTSWQTVYLIFGNMTKAPMFGHNALTLLEPEGELLVVLL